MSTRASEQNPQRRTAPVLRAHLPLPARLLRAAAPLPGAALCAAILLGGCGSPGSPQPPSLKLPAPASDLAATRSGRLVTLHWTMPRRATDRVPLTGDQRVVICRSLGAATPCDPVGNVLLEAGLPASYTDQLPPSLLTGSPQLLTYTVLLENHNHRGAGPSNPAYTLAGSPPPAITGLRAQVEPSGVVLHWQPLASSAPSGTPLEVEDLLRLHRTRKLAPGESPAPSSQESRAGIPQSLEQTLEVPEAASVSLSLNQGWRLDHAVDQDAALNRTYLYTVERVARVRLSGHTIEVSGGSSEPLTIEARDLFPPAVPQGLEAVADSEGRAIDLSWSPDADPDLAGYFVYRRVSGSAGPPVRASGEAALPNAAWRDTSVQTSVRYAYSVSAVDTSGNESERAPEVSEATEEVTHDASPAPAKVPRTTPRSPLHSRNHFPFGAVSPVAHIP